MLARSISAEPTWLPSTSMPTSNRWARSDRTSRDEMSQLLALADKGIRALVAAQRAALAA